MIVTIQTIKCNVNSCKNKLTIEGTKHDAFLKAKEQGWKWVNKDVHYCKTHNELSDELKNESKVEDE